MQDTLAIILAGGAGKRLGPLTQDPIHGLAKPAVPFAGKFRLVDFPLFNAINSGIHRVYVLTMFRSWPLQQHIERLQLNDDVSKRYVSSLFPSHEDEEHVRYTHTANAVYQNRSFLASHREATRVLILSGDHVYKQDYRRMRDFHIEKGSSFTVCGKWVTPDEARGNFGVMVLDENGKIIGFEEKSEDPKTGPNGLCFASLGIYLAEKDELLSVLEDDHNDPGSGHDFGGDIIPGLIDASAEIYAYDFNEYTIPGENAPYWMDVGRPDVYLEAHRDLAASEPALNLYNAEWPIMTRRDNLSPAKIVSLKDPHGSDAAEIREFALQHLMEGVPGGLSSGGCIFDAPNYLHEVVAGRTVHIGRFSVLESVVLHDGATVGRSVKMQRAIVMAGARIPDGVTIGFDAGHDAQRGLYVDEESGVVIVPPEGVDWAA